MIPVTQSQGITTTITKKQSNLAFMATSKVPVPSCSDCLAPSRIIRPCSICRIVLSNTMIKTCINCGRGFQPTAKNQVFCSTTCRTNFHNKRRCQKAIKEDKSIVPAFSDFGFSNRANSHSCFNCGKYVETPYKLCDKCRNAFVNKCLGLDK